MGFEPTRRFRENLTLPLRHILIEQKCPNQVKRLRNIRRYRLTVPKVGFEPTSLSQVRVSGIAPPLCLPSYGSSLLFDQHSDIRSKILELNQCLCLTKAPY